MAAKFKLMWENNPDTPIDATTLSEVTNSASEMGGILYKDIPQLIPNGDYSDSFLKLRANSRVLLKTYETRAMFFNTPGTLVSHNSMFGPIAQDNVVFLKDSVNNTNSIYAGLGTTNLLSNPGFEGGFAPDWEVSVEDETQDPGYVDPVYGEEYEAIVEVSNDGFESGKSARMYNGAFGRTEISRSVDLTGKPVVSISFYYKSTGGLRFYITSGSLYWKDNDWNPSTSAFYELPASTEWKRFEVKNIITQKISATAENVGIYIYSDIAGGDSYIDSVQLEELPFASPYVEDSRADSLLKYPVSIIRADKGYVDLTIYPKDVRDFTLFSVPTDLTENAVELIYIKLLDQFQIRVWDTATGDYLTLGTAARLSERIDTWTRVICGWDKDYGLKIITTSSPTIEREATPFTPYPRERIQSLDIASSRATMLGNFFIDNMKVNVELKEDVAIIKDFERVYSVIDDDSYRVFHVGEEAVVIDSSYLDIGDSFEALTNYYIWVVDNLNDDDGKIYVSQSTERPAGISELQIATLFAGFRTDDSAQPMASSVWDITERDDRIHTKRLMVNGVDSNSYNFDVRTQDYAETSDVRSTIPVHFSDNLYGRHTNDSVIHPEVGTHEVQYFEINTEGWMAIDNIKIDANKITTRDYADSLGAKNNNLELTSWGEPSKIWIHSHEVDIDSGNRDIKLDLLRIDENILYTKELTDLKIDVSHTDNPTDRNDIYLIGHDIFIQPTNDLQFDINADFVVNAGRHFLFDAGQDFRLTTGGQIELDDININDNNIFNDTGDVHIYSSATVNIDSGSGQIELDGIHIKSNLIHRDAGDIKIETPDDIIIGRAGTGTNPHASTVSIRSDRFVVESQAVEFTNVDASDFIRFDSIKMRQSEIYTDAGTPMSINSAGTLTAHSDNNIYLNTSNNLEIQETGGNFISRVKSTFTKDLNILNLNFTDVHFSDQARIFTTAVDTTSTFHIQVADDAQDKIFIEHAPSVGGTGNAMLQIAQHNVTVNEDLIVNGNLTVQGDQTILNTATLAVEDNLIVVNKNVTGTPSLDAGLIVERGTATNSRLIWDESEDLWRLDNGNGVLHNLIFNGYDERFSENVNIVTTEPAGFKLENDAAVGGMELLNPNTYNLAVGEAIMNMGLHMNYSGGYIKDKLNPNGTTYNTNSVGAFIKIDTRAAQKKFSFTWEEAGSNAEYVPLEVHHDGNLYTKSISSNNSDPLLIDTRGATIRSSVAGQAALKVLHNIDDGGNTAALIVANDGEPSDVLADFRSNGSGVTVDITDASDSPDSKFKIMGNGDVVTTGSLQLGASGKLNYGNSPTGSAPLEYNGYFYATRVYNAVYNDLAEYFLAEDEVKPGRVYTFNDNGKLVFSSRRADKNVAGVCSNTPAFVMKQEYEKQGGVPVALAGSVDVWVRGPVDVGDELVSDKDGFACKARWYDKIFNRSAIIGKALKKNPSGESRILMFVKNV